MGFLDKLKFSRLKDGLAKTRDNIIEKVTRVIKAKRKIDESLLDEIEEILITGDVGVATTSLIIDRVKERVKKERYEDSDELLRFSNDILLYLIHLIPPIKYGGNRKGELYPYQTV